jgi:hypothetical protein
MAETPISRICFLIYLLSRILYNVLICLSNSYDEEYKSLNIFFLIIEISLAKGTK